MKTKSNMTVSKLQSEAVKELMSIEDFEESLRFDLNEDWYERTPLEKERVIKLLLSDQIQKAYSEGREEVLKELRVRIDTWGGFEDDGGNLCHYDSQIIEYLDDLSIDYDGIAETVIKLHKQSK